MTREDVTKKKHTTSEGTRKRQISRLLHFVELLHQGLAVKQQAVYLFPSFLRAAIAWESAHKDLRELAELGEHLVQHVNVLTHVSASLGGALVDVETTQPWGDAKEPLSAMRLQEETAIKIFDECDAMLTNDWDASSQLKLWLHERLEIVSAETKEHRQLFARLFGDRELQYRDPVLRRFHVTAVS